jgi:hypothetical protein
MDDADFWRPVDGDENVWYKFENDIDVVVTDASKAYSPGTVKAEYRCRGIFGCGHEQVCLYVTATCDVSRAGKDKDGDQLPGVLVDPKYLSDIKNTAAYRNAIQTIRDQIADWERKHSRGTSRR